MKENKRPNPYRATAFRLAAVLGAIFLASGCSWLTGTPAAASANLPEPTLQELIPTLEPADGLDCQEVFEKRELREPYQRQDGDQPRYTLSSKELEDYLNLMGIESLCVPAAFGAPFLNVDWNEADLPAAGRMVSLGFENLYSGGGWSSAYLVYSTYDFEIGSEYESFALKEDYQAMQSGTIAADLQAGSAAGFVRYQAGIPMGGQLIMKTYVFPFEEDYVAGVVNLGVYDPAEVEAALAEMEDGIHPDLTQEIVRLMDDLMRTLVFKP